MEQSLTKNMVVHSTKIRQRERGAYTASFPSMNNRMVATRQRIDPIQPNHQPPIPAMTPKIRMKIGALGLFVSIILWNTKRIRNPKTMVTMPNPMFTTLPLKMYPARRLSTNQRLFSPTCMHPPTMRRIAPTRVRVFALSTCDNRFHL